MKQLRLSYSLVGLAVLTLSATCAHGQVNHTAPVTITGSTAEIRLVDSTTGAAA